MTDVKRKKQSTRSAEKNTAGRSAATNKTASSDGQPRVLRIGIIQSGKILEERIIRKREPIFVGQSEKNRFVLPQEDLNAARFCLFETRGNGSPYYLNFVDGMTGKLSAGGEVLDLGDAVSGGKASRKAKHYQLELKEDARGKVVIGNTTVLFQFVTPPPVQPRPQLPAAVRGSPLQGFELVISICVAVSLMFHLSMILYFQMTDWPERTLEEKYAMLQQLLRADTATFEDAQKTKTDEGEGDQGEEFEDEVVDDDRKPEPAKEAPSDAPAEGPAKSAEQIAQERADRRAELAQQIAQTGINKILASLGGAGEGAVIDVLGGGDVSANQAELLAQVRGVGVASGSDSVLKGPAGGAGSGEAADISQIKTGGGDKVVKTAGPGAEKAISGNVQRRAPTVSGGTGMLSPQDVANVVAQRLTAIKSCYERSLKRDPSLRGRVTIRFTIAGTGRVSTARATTNELGDDVAKCIVDVFDRFRFPPPDGGEVTLEYPFMFTPSN